jgi:hypothetical protein
VSPREAAITAAGRALAEATARRDALSPRAAAEEAHAPGGPPVEELEQRIRDRRAQRAEIAA